MVSYFLWTKKMIKKIIIEVSVLLNGFSLWISFDHSFFFFFTTKQTSERTLIFLLLVYFAWYGRYSNKHKRFLVRVSRKNPSSLMIIFVDVVAALLTFINIFKILAHMGSMWCICAFWCNFACCVSFFLIANLWDIILFDTTGVDVSFFEKEKKTCQKHRGMNWMTETKTTVHLKYKAKLPITYRT